MRWKGDKNSEREREDVLCGDKQEGNHGSSTAIKAINSNQSISTHYCHSHMIVHPLCLMNGCCFSELHLSHSALTSQNLFLSFERKQNIL